MTTAETDTATKSLNWVGEGVAIAVRKDDQPLRDRLNTELLHWRENGQLDAILDHWIRGRKVTIEINSPPE